MPYSPPLVPIRMWPLTAVGAMVSRIAFLRIGDFLAPFHGAGLGVEGDQLGVEGREIDVVAVGGDAAIVRAAAIGRDRPHLVRVGPELLAGPGVQREHMIERGRDIHHAIDHDRRSFHRVDDVGLEDPGRPKLADVASVDLPRRIVTRLGVIAVRLKEVVAVARGAVEQVLRDGIHIAIHRRRHGLGSRRRLDLRHCGLGIVRIS